MVKISRKTAERVTSGLKRFAPILSSAKARDVNESDTVVIVTDLLQEVFGYDKYSDITSEYMIRGTFCDLAVKLDGNLAALVEVKAIGLDLKEQHIKQAVDYAANKGCDWVVLTNATIWRVYKITFSKPIDHELVVEFDLLKLNPRKSEDIELVALLAKEGWQKAHLGAYADRREALNRFTLGALLLNEPVLEVLRREVRRISPNIRVELEEIKGMLLDEVIKREVLEGEKADAARKQLSRAAGKALRATKAGLEVASSSDDTPPSNSSEGIS